VLVVYDPARAVDMASTCQVTLGDCVCAAVQAAEQTADTLQPSAQVAGLDGATFATDSWPADDAAG
jgi:hypothetical protein